MSTKQNDMALDPLARLRESAERTGNIFCLGMDLVPDAIPAEIQDENGNPNVAEYGKQILAMLNMQGHHPAMIKPNLGFYVSLDDPRKKIFTGSEALADIMELGNTIHSNTAWNIDSKNADIGPSSKNYARYVYERWQADAMTVHPYMGPDSVKPFAEYCKQGKICYLLCRTSNEGAKRLQAQKLENGQAVYEYTADEIIALAKEFPGVGAVVGATSLDELRKVATQFVESGVAIPLLIPGVGRQGGSAKEVVAVLREVGYDLRIVRINSSSGITHPWYKQQQPAPDNWKKVVLAAYEALLEETSLRNVA
jgi:orotidine-5'-phosphate decarboxylase